MLDSKYDAYNSHNLNDSTTSFFINSLTYTSNQDRISPWGDKYEIEEKYHFRDY